MNAEELNIFLDELTETAEPDRLEKILAIKTMFGEMADAETTALAKIEELNTSIMALSELNKKYETLIKSYIKETPVTTAITTGTKSDYDDFSEEV